MGSRVLSDTSRPPPIEIIFDGRSISAYPGETIAAALIASDIAACRTDTRGKLRGPYCNMGTCFECLVEIRTPGHSTAGGANWYRVRACLTVVSADLEVRSAGATRTFEL